MNKHLTKADKTAQMSIIMLAHFSYEYTIHSFICKYICSRTTDLSVTFLED